MAVIGTLGAVIVIGVLFATSVTVMGSATNNVSNRGGKVTVVGAPGAVTVIDVPFTTSVIVTGSGKKHCL